MDQTGETILRLRSEKRELELQIERFKVAELQVRDNAEWVKALEAVYDEAQQVWVYRNEKDYKSLLVAMALSKC